MKKSYNDTFICQILQFDMKSHYVTYNTMFPRSLMMTKKRLETEWSLHWKMTEFESLILEWRNYSELSHEDIWLFSLCKRSDVLQLPLNNVYYYLLCSIRRKIKSCVKGEKTSSFNCFHATVCHIIISPEIALNYALACNALTYKFKQKLCKNYTI